MRRSRIATGVAVALAGPVLLATPALADHGTYTGVVVEVRDGDSIVVDLDDGPVQIVRLVGVDADEEYQCYYSEAKAHAEAGLLGQAVTLRKDRLNDQSDSVRLFAYVYVGDTLFNHQQIRAGHARERSYGPDYQLRAEFIAADQAARSEGLGRWSEDYDCAADQP